MPDEVFHGHGADDALHPTDEPYVLNSRLHTGGIGGEPRLWYSDTVLTCGNGQVNADLAVSGLADGVLCAVPFVSWFSPRHRQALKFGWFEVSVLVNGAPQTIRRYRSWYEAGAVATAQFTGGALGHQLDLRAQLGAPPDQPQVALVFALHNRTDQTMSVRFVIRGEARLGEEAGSFYDAVNGTVGRRRPNPVDCTTNLDDHGLQIDNAAARVYARLTADSRLARGTVQPEPRPLHQGPQPQERPTTCFQLEFCRGVRSGERAELRLGLEFSNRPIVSSRRLPSARQATGAWARRLAHVGALQTPDALLTAALRRAAAYALSLTYRIGRTDRLVCHCDHLEWPVDCARDTFHIVNALLLLEPERVQQHLRFHLLEAIPRAGAGRSYIGRGISCGQRDARLLDLASYPLWELYRYWRATGDDEFVADPRLRATTDRMVQQVVGWRSADCGLFASTERSSDERCVLPYFVPGNLLFLATIEKLAELYEEAHRDPAAAADLRALATDGRRAVAEHAIVDDPEFGRMYAFEVGAGGQTLLYDHADIPNLLSATRFGYCSPDDPVYQNTVRFAYSARNQGYRGTRAGKYAELCDGSKTMPYSPWPLGALGHLMSGLVDAAEARRLVDWLRDCLTPALQLPEIVDRHTGRPVQRYWFGWPTAMLLMVYIETLCGVTIGRDIELSPLVPAGWDEYRSPVLQIRGEACQVIVRDGQAEKVPVAR